MSRYDKVIKAYLERYQKNEKNETTVSLQASTQREREADLS